MNALKLTDAIARNATLPNCGRNDIILWDGALTGFGLRVRQTSKGIGKTWVVQYRDALGATRRYILGTVAELNAARARDLAADKLLKVRGGDFPHLERAQRAKAAELREVRKVEIDPPDQPRGWAPLWSRPRRRVVRDGRSVRPVQP
jgi:Arm DNA-binding domain